MTTILNRRPFDAATTANNLNSQPIRLQLKKPKNWGWQLTTSKSTPDIVIPMIQLLNYRGSVLLEAVDVGRGCDKQFWSSSELNRKINNDKDCNYHLRQSQATTNICGRRSPLSSGSSTTSIVNGNYKMRTCRAGTLIVTGESFHQSDNHHQRRRRHKSNSCDEVIIPRDYKVDNRSGKDIQNSCESSYSTGSNGSLPVVLLADNNSALWQRGRRQQTLLRSSVSDDNNNYSHSDSGRCITNCIHDLDYKESSCSEPNAPSLAAKSPSTPGGYHHHHQQQHQNVVSSIRGMGANVSRHSTKGLSGRRSQSNNSICQNGKGRHSSASTVPPGDKVSASLPNYLVDERQQANDNYEDKPPAIFEGSTTAQQVYWKFSDGQTTVEPTTTVLYDQGYASERSPEDEGSSIVIGRGASQRNLHLNPYACYPFITPETTFVVKLLKSSRGLGLSVTGGVDTGGSWPGLIRIKRLFPHQPAANCGFLNVGDLIIEANGVQLTGLTNYEALEVLRTANSQVELKMCRPPPDVLSCVSPVSEVPPPPPIRRKDTSLLCLSHNFEVILQKIHGSLGFTLRKEDDSALGHYVRALVREPALTDGRLCVGDKIIAVNDVEISQMSHEQAVQFLRNCGDLVKLRLYRDGGGETPVSALSPTEMTPRASFSRHKPHLRQEAIDMLNEIAVRRLINENDIDPHYACVSPAISPHRSRVTTNSYSTEEEEQFHEALFQAAPTGSAAAAHRLDEDAFNALFLQNGDAEDDDEEDDGSGEPNSMSRPSSLDLYNPNQTPAVCRKPRFNFSLAHNAYELNNLDADVLDAPNLTYEAITEEEPSTQEAVSMPYLPTTVSQVPEFQHKQPLYQSVAVHYSPPPPASGTKTTAQMSSAHHALNTKRKEPHKTEFEMLEIELNRGWNSRLGFSLQTDTNSCATFVSAVYSDSVAAKDGRIQPGDRVLKVNDESVEHLSTNEIIELLRIVRGPISIAVLREKSKARTGRLQDENSSK